MTTLEERRDQIRSDFDATNQEIASLQNSITERQFKLARLDERFRAYTELIEEADAAKVTEALPVLDDLAAKRAALLAEAAELQAVMDGERGPVEDRLPSGERANLAIVKSTDTDSAPGTPPDEQENHHGRR